MTRHLPRHQLAKSAVAPPVSAPERAALEHFKGSPAGQMQAALAALYRFLPGLGVEPDDDWHARHMLLWPNDDKYFLRVCRLLKAYGVGSHLGEG
jgi:hypothetical protein